MQPSELRIIRGRTLSFLREPIGPDDDDAYVYRTDGALAVRDGMILAAGDYADVARDYPGAQVDDHRPHLVLPGFIDTHLHFPQTQVIASWGAELLDWLNTYTFPEEAKYADPAHCQAMADRFLDLLLAHGTTTGVVYGSVHKPSAEALFAASHARGMRMIVGKVMMDRNAPEGVLDTAQSGYDDTKALINDWHGKGRIGVAITPRFAITSTPEQLEAAGALAAEHPEAWVQTHLSENRAEIELTKSLFPDAPDYLGVYERFGLLGARSLMGHAIHLTERERALMAETGTVAVFCPTSNLFLGSGLYDADGLRADGVRRAVATDIGGGTSYSMLRTLDEGYKALALRGQRMTPLAGFWWATLGNAQALGLEGQIGTLEQGTEADIIVLDAAATPAMAQRFETVETLAEELFLLQVLGDDRAVTGVYVGGVSVQVGT